MGSNSRPAKISGLRAPMRRRKPRDPAAPEGAEKTLRFALDPNDCELLLARLSKAGAHWTAETKLLSLYLDTPDCAIGKLGFGFGVRRRGDVTLNDTKEALRRFARGQPGVGGWSTFRHALSVAAPTDARELQKLLRGPNARQSLKLVYQSEAQQSFWSLPFGGDASLVLEQANIVNGIHTRLASLTLIYPENAAGLALAFIATLGKSVPLRLTGETLALTAYQTAGHSDVATPAAITPRLTADTSVAAAFQAIAHAAIDHFLLAQVRVRRLHDVEGVHQCRVALRRFSTALRLFRPLIGGAGAKAVKEDLNRIKSSLRAARDIDVLLARLAGKDADSAVATVRKLLEARREKTYAALVDVLNAPGTEDSLLRVVTWIEAGDWTADAARAEPIGTFVQRKFSKSVPKFHRRCADLEEASPAERHQTRIRAKNLRYGAEFFDGLSAGADAKAFRKRLRGFVAALKKLQTFLGEENDAEMAQHYFARLAEDGDSVRADAAAVAAGAALAAKLRRRGKRQFHKGAEKAREALFDTKPFWTGLARD
ncbi:CHAD domain-containing protein [Methylovirgula ligni]|uniref:CHAD domain-containing protein n=2 Tax=Methylovirgula ligni TaxID=569860 RepID=A0A3D9Z288_9HYPH|nr:CHAD domain-containing protein [Methylovirgula ligni]REF89283.1 CHAD domain-containing protein [Methylovirgula ligni]